MSNIIEALTFVNIIQRKAGTIAERFVKIQHGWVFANGPIVSCGHPIDTDLNICVDSFKFLEALKFSKGQEYSIIQLTKESIAVSGNGFRFVVDTIDNEEIQIPISDRNVGQIGDSVRETFKIILPLVSEKHDKAYGKCAILKPNVVAASCNGTALIEAWHGYDMPPVNLALPEAFIKAIAHRDAKTPLAGIGYSKNSVTFWNETGGFVKTHLYNVDWPEYQILLKTAPEYDKFSEIPNDLFKSIRNIVKFSKDKQKVVRFGNGKIGNTMYDETSSFYSVPWLDSEMTFNAELVLNCESAMKFAYFDEEISYLFFYNEIARGVIAGFGNTKVSENKIGSKLVDDYDDDIPF